MWCQRRSHYEHECMQKKKYMERVQENKTSSGPKPSASVINDGVEIKLGNPTAPGNGQGGW